MSGTFGFDGYIYQSIVTIFLTLQTLNSISDVDKIEIEVRRKEPGENKDTYNVDLIIYCEGQKANIYEIKGGSKRINVADVIDPNFAAINEDFIKNGLYEPKFFIVCKDESKLFNNVSGYEPKQLDNYINASSSCLTHLEHCVIGEIEEFCKNYCKVDNPTHDLTRRIMFSIRHLIEFKIQVLAQNLRGGTQLVEKVVITKDDLLNHQGSFAEAIWQELRDNPPFEKNKFAAEVSKAILEKHEAKESLTEMTYAEK